MIINEGERDTSRIKDVDEGKGRERETESERESYSNVNLSKFMERIILIILKFWSCHNLP